MNLNKKNLFIIFINCLLFTLIMPVIAPSLRLLYFVPFLIILFYQKSFSYSLWASSLSGLIIDLLSTQPPFGFHACLYSLATAILYHQKRNFFADHLSTLPIMTFLFSCLVTVLAVGVLLIFGTPIVLGWTWIFSDLLAMPLCDAVFAFLWFILIPISFQQKSQRRASVT